MRRIGIMVDSEGLPLLDIIMSKLGVFFRIHRVVRHLGYHGHSLNTNYPLQCEIGLVPILSAIPIQLERLDLR